MVAGEGRPKRACADGIDYAGTDQVPGWTVRETRKLCFHFSGFVLSLNIFEIIRERKRMRGQSRSPPLFLVRSSLSLSLSLSLSRILRFSSSHSRLYHPSRSRRRSTNNNTTARSLSRYFSHFFMFNSGGNTRRSCVSLEPTRVPLSSHPRNLSPSAF